MNTFMLKIASPDGNVFEGEAVMLSLRGSDGDLAVMANHIPFVTGIKPCKIKALLPDESEFFGTVDGGLLTVKNNAVTVLSGSFTKE